MKNLQFLLLLLLSLHTIAQSRTQIPDENFEQALIDLGYDSGSIDHSVPTANINTITSLNVSGKNIFDLTGIQDFVALEGLYCMDNKLTSLNVTKNTKLETLRCYINDIKSLNLTQNVALAILSCNDNNISRLDLSNNREVFSNRQSINFMFHLFLFPLVHLVNIPNNAALSSHSKKGTLFYPSSPTDHLTSPSIVSTPVACPLPLGCTATLLRIIFLLAESNTILSHNKPLIFGPQPSVT